MVCTLGLIAGPIQFSVAPVLSDRPANLMTWVIRLPVVGELLSVRPTKQCTSGGVLLAILLNRDTVLAGR